MYFNGSCSFSIEGPYQMTYESNINGYISKDKLTRLSGVSVSVPFLSFNIDEVKRNGDKLKSSVGVISAEFGINYFYKSPRCGWGFNYKSIEENRQRKGNRNNSLNFENYTSEKKKVMPNLNIEISFILPSFYLYICIHQAIKF